jgi:hypothetical protein
MERAAGKLPARRSLGVPGKTIRQRVQPLTPVVATFTLVLDGAVDSRGGLTVPAEPDGMLSTVASGGHVQVRGGRVTEIVRCQIDTALLRLAVSRCGDTPSASG